MATFLVHEKVVFEDQVIYLAGNSYFDCTFRRCTLVVREQIGPLTGCCIESCIWHLDLLISDHEYWDSFLGRIAPAITQSLPRAPGKK